MISLARSRHPQLDFVEMDAIDLENLPSQFDVIILCDTINDLWDIQKVFENIRHVCGPKTRVVISYYSPLAPLSIDRN
jgi:ubiquinone/menaquinone biosynthesis C-methylase UbiE